VVDVRDGSLARNKQIIIADGRIVRIVPAGSVGVAGKARRIDGRNAFVVPGFNDMHTHNLNTASPQTSLPLMLATGITGIRQMAPALPGFPKGADGQPVLPADSPALLSMSGNLIAGPAFATPEASRLEVEKQRAGQVGFLKMVDQPQAAFLATVDAAEIAGLKTAGHLPMTVDPREAIDHGFDSIEHLGPSISLLLSCSTDEAQIRGMLRALPPAPVGIDFNMEPAKLARLLANPVLLSPPQSFAVMRRVLATYSEEKCSKFARDIAASKAWVVPTLTRLEAMNLGNSAALRTNPDLRYVPAASRTLWLAVGDDFQAKLNAEQQQILADLYASQLRLAKLFEVSGVKMMAGTDFGGQWIVPGHSLHREFDLLAGAGLTPLSILQMTTLNPAIYLGREADMGTVEPGKQADLVLLAANPVRNTSNLHRISAVVRGGRFFSRAELDAISAREAAALK
jgi:Amidohydrolase family